MKGELAAQFAESTDCVTPFYSGQLRLLPRSGVMLPDRFDTQINLRPGDYDLQLVVTDGKNFGRARSPLHIEPLSSQRLMTSDVAIGGGVRYVGWVLREATAVSPAPVIPTPLVSKDREYLPDSEDPARVHKHTPLYVYFEIYEPQAETPGLPIYYRWRITDQKTGLVVLTTDPLSAAEFLSTGNAVIPIGLKLDTEKLKKGTYKFEVQASDSAGRESERRATKFNIQ